MRRELDKTWESLTESGIATDEELKLVTCINGYNVQTLNDVISGYRSLEQLQEAENDE